MKVRDIQRSHEFRESVKKWGAPHSRNRVFIAAPLNNAAENDINLEAVVDRGVKEALDDVIYNIDREIEYKRAEHEQLKSWIQERKLLRKNLNTIGFSGSWYANKPNKTECEIRVYEKQNEKKMEKTKILHTTIKRHQHNKQRLSAGHVDMLPLLDSPLPLALAIIADYLHDNRLRLIDLFSKVDRNKDWMMTRDELKDSLKGTNIPLKDSHLDELLIMLDVNNDDQLSYKELAVGIDAYNKDKRWQKLKYMYDNLINENDERDKSKTPLIENTHLHLPRLDTRELTSELLSQQRARERRLRKQQEKKSKQRVRSRSLIKPVKDETMTTLGGTSGEIKLQYIQKLNEECLKCIDRLHANGVEITSKTMKKVLVLPYDNPKNLCEAYLSSDRSLLPKNHPHSKHYRRTQQKKLEQLDPALSPTVKDVKVKSIHYSGNMPLPRVARLDFKNRRKEAQKLRHQRACTSPTACWPQHLLDKICLCMDDQGNGDGKSILFNQIKR